MTISTINVPDMHCSACSNRIRQALAMLGGIEATYVNPARRQVLVEHPPGIASLDILTTIESAGFRPSLTGVEDHDLQQKQLLKRLGIAGLAMMQVMMAAIALYAGALEDMNEATRRLLEYASLLFCIPVVAYSAMPFFTGAIRAAKTGINMDVPIALAILIAFGVSLDATLTGSGDVYYDSVVMFTFLLLGARYIESRLRQQFTCSSNVLAALPATALRIDADTRDPVSLETLQPGDRIWIPQGEQIPVDGVLDDERALTDEAILTGESEWVEKAHEAQLWAGTLNRGPGFAMTATASCERSRISDIATLAEKTELEQAPVAVLADRIAGYFIPTILLLATLVFCIWQWLDPAKSVVAALTVLVVSCPCALSLATPAALTAALTRLRREGVVLTRGAALEQAARVNLALIDKTGTLTIHEPRLHESVLLGTELTLAQCLDLAGALQRYANHPIARAFPTAGAMAVSDVHIQAGQGLRGEWRGRTLRMGTAAFCGIANSTDNAIYLSLDHNPLARFELSDEVRVDAREALADLQQLGVEPIMLSGDSPGRCEALATGLNIGYLARQTPESKLAYLKARRSNGDHLLMLGDGINDVPVLAGADVSAAVVEASELVKSKADVLLLTRRLQPVAELIRVARRTSRVTRQNLFWALAYNLTAIPIAALGLMPPWLAAVGMASSSTLVMFNASRLLER